MDVSARTSRTGKDVPFGRRQLVVWDQTGSQQSWTSTQVHPFEFADQIHLGAGRTRRFDVCFRVADPGSYLWLQIPDWFPTRMVKLHNPWVPADQLQLAAGEPLEVISSPGLEIAHTPPSLLPEPAPRGIEGVGFTLPSRPGSER